MQVQIVVEENHEPTVKHEEIEKYEEKSFGVVDHDKNEIQLANSAKNIENDSILEPLSAASSDAKSKFEVV